MSVQIPNTNPGKNEQRGLEIIFTEEKRNNRNITSSAIAKTLVVLKFKRFMYLVSLKLDQST